MTIFYTSNINSGISNEIRVALTGIVLSILIGCGGGQSTRSTPAPSQEPKPSVQSPPKTSPATEYKAPDSGPVIGATQPKPVEPPPAPAVPAPPPAPAPKKVQVAPPATSPKSSRPPVRKTRPAPEPSDPFGALLGKRPQITAQESSSGSSIRGLSPLAKDYAKRSHYPQDSINAVKQMERFQVDRKSLSRFLKEGGLNPR